MKKPLTFLLSLAITSPLIASAEETACLQTNETPFEIISCLDKRGIDLTEQRDKLYQAQIDTLQNRISYRCSDKYFGPNIGQIGETSEVFRARHFSESLYLETLIQLQQRQLDALKQAKSNFNTIMPS